MIGATKKKAKVRACLVLHQVGPVGACLLASMVRIGRGRGTVHVIVVVVAVVAAAAAAAIVVGRGQRVDARVRIVRGLDAGQGCAFAM